MAQSSRGTDPSSSGPGPSGQGQTNQLSWRFRNSTQQTMENPTPANPQIFPIGQTWNAIPQTLQFVDETAGVAGAYETTTGNSANRRAPEQPLVTSSGNGPPPPPPPPPPLPPPPPPPQELTVFPQVEITQQFGSDPLLGHSTTILPLSVPDYVLAAIPQPPIGEPDFASIMTRVDRPIWPVENMHEHGLYKAFLNHVAPIFDLCDHECHFLEVVPKRATGCKALRYAMLATAAKYLTKFGGDTDSMCAEYSVKCYNTLVPSLSSEAATVDEDLWAAVVILRFMEEVDQPFSRNGSQSHIIGSRLFLLSQSKVFEFEGLRLATFWCALRQEIFSAIVHGRQIQLTELTARIVPMEHPFNHPGDCDCSYANRVIVHCAACVQICYNEELPSSDEWQDHMNRLDNWWNNRPWRFDAVSFTPEHAQASFFPEKVCFGEAPLTALQHFYLAKIIMLMRNPKVPVTGLNRGTFLRDMDIEIKENVRILCGLAQSNQNISPAFAIACLAINLTAARFTGQEEQVALCEFLHLANVKSPWQTYSLQAELKAMWGWSIQPMNVVA